MLAVLGPDTGTAQVATSPGLLGMGHRHRNSGRPERLPDNRKPATGSRDNGAEAADPNAPTAPPFGRPAAVDGVLAQPAEAPAAPDGIVVDTEPPAPVDGVDPTIDTRPDTEAQAFAYPRTEEEQAAVALALAPEPNPALDRRPGRLFRFEPYDPIGIKVGSFLLFPEATIDIAATSNLFRTQSGQKGDVALETAPSARLVSDWSRHALELSLRSVDSFHNRYPSEDDRAWTAEARGRLDITRRTNIEAFVGHDVTQDSRGSVNSTADINGRPDITTDRTGVTLNHRFNRLSLQLRGAVTDRTVDPVSGSADTTSDRDYTEREGALRAQWEFKPTLSVFGEAGVNEYDYKRSSLSDGISRNSSGERYRVGVSFGNTAQVLRGEVSIGTARQDFDDTRLPTLKGVIVDANLGWRINALTSLRLTARSDLGESTVAGAGGAMTRSIGGEVRHAFRRHLIATAGVTYARSDYAGADLVEQTVTTNAGLEYYLNREITLFGRYTHIDYDTTNIGADYSVDEVRVGVRLRR
ncbi:MAG: outer membrane beta-barrel protein [Hyphomicrobiaceae bacterium]